MTLGDTRSGEAGRVRWGRLSQYAPLNRGPKIFVEKNTSKRKIGKGKVVVRGLGSCIGVYVQVGADLTVKAAQIWEG